VLSYLLNDISNTKYITSLIYSVRANSLSSILQVSTIQYDRVQQAVDRPNGT